MRTPTITEFKAWARNNKELAHAVLMAQSYAETKRKQVDAYIAPIFAKFKFYPSDDMLSMKGTDSRRGVANEQITDIRDLYMTDLEGVEYLTFCKLCDDEHRKHGFTGKPGYCPALMAEDMLIKAQNVLLESGCALLGLRDIPFAPAHRKQMLDLLIGGCFAKDRIAA
jgi:hypothetical protein